MGKAKGPRKKTTPDLGELGNLLDRFRTSMDNLDKIDEMEKALEPAQAIHKQFEIDTDKIETLDDVREVIKAMQMVIYFYGEECPDKFKTLLERNLLKEIKDESI